MTLSDALKHPFVEGITGLVPASAVNPLAEHGEHTSAVVCVALAATAVLHAVYRHDHLNPERAEPPVCEPSNTETE
jgi:hypothetical protein